MIIEHADCQLLHVLPARPRASAEETRQGRQAHIVTLLVQLRTDTGLTGVGFAYALQGTGRGLYYTATDDSYVAARLAANTFYAPNKTWTIQHTLELFPSVEDTDDFYGRSDLKASATLSENMLAQVQWIMDYDNTPPTGNDRIDNRYLLSIGWKF